MKCSNIITSPVAGENITLAALQMMYISLFLGCACEIMFNVTINISIDIAIDIAITVNKFIGVITA